MHVKYYLPHQSAGERQDHTLVPRSYPCLHLHWHTVVKLLYGLVVDCDGHLRVGVKGELNIVAGPVLPRRLVTRQLQVLAASAQGRRGTFQIAGK